MRRRELLAAIAALLPIAGRGAEPEGRHRATIFGRYFSSDLGQYRDRWNEWFAEHGFIEGRNFTLTMVNTGYRTNEELEPVVREIVASRPGVIIVFGTPWTRMFQRLTSEIPIVFLRVADPVQAGFVRSLAKPGANLTGLANRYFDLERKRLEVIKELTPRARRVANLCEEGNNMLGAELRSTAKRMGLDLVDVFVSEGSDADTIAKALRGARVDAVLFGLDAPRLQTLKALNRLRMPVIYSDNRTVEEGGLISLGERLPGPGKVAASIASRILRGERPATIPVDQASAIHLAVNLKTARDMDLVVPATLRLRADQVIE